MYVYFTWYVTHPWFCILGEFVAQFKFTVLLMPNGPLKITGLPVDLSLYPTDKSVEDKELKVRPQYDRIYFTRTPIKGEIYSDIKIVLMKSEKWEE